MANLIPFNRRRNEMTTPNFDNFYNMLDDFFSDGFLPRNLNRDTFKIDVEDNEGSYCISAEMPGVNKDEISLTFNEGGQLVISVKKEENLNEEKKNYIHRERRISSMSRSIYLAGADKDGVKAKLDGGVLTIEVAKAKAESGSRSIDIE